MSKLTMGNLFLKRIQESGEQNAVGKINHDTISFLNFNEYYKKVETIALALSSIGHKISTPLSILSTTRFEWNLFDLANMCAGGVTIPIYPTYLAEEIIYIFNHSESSMFVVEDKEQIEKILPSISQLQKLEVLISIESVDDEVRNKIPSTVKFLTFDELFEMGLKEQEAHEGKFKSMIDAVQETHLASIIYTSGTTGEPKGAVVTNMAFAKMLENVRGSLNKYFRSSDRTLTWLPLSHVFGRCDSLLPLAFGWEKVYSRGMDHLIEDISLAKPSIMLAVPRIFEKIYAKINDQVESGSFIKKSLFKWANTASDAYFDKIEKDLSPSTSEIIQRNLAYKIVLSKVYHRFGGKLRFFVSGGAPLSPTIIRFLRNCNLTVLEGYGLTETIAPVCINTPAKQIPGTVGLPVGDVEFKIADDGELLIKTEAMLREYYKRPEETAEAMKDGWFYSGDIAEFNSEGYLKITDRKKEILITSGGKNVAPQKIENIAKTKKYIAQFVVVGDQRKYLTAIVGIEKEPFAETGVDGNSTLEELSKDPKVKELIQANIDEVNKELSQYETIKKFCIAPMEFTVESGMITPSLKVKRKVVYKQFSDEIESMY